MATYLREHYKYKARFSRVQALPTLRSNQIQVLSKLEASAPAARFSPS